MPQADEQDTSVDEAVDTSTNEDSEDTGDLEDIEVSPEELGDETEQTEDSEDEKEETDTEPENTEEESEEDEVTEGDEPEEAELSDQDKQKAYNKQMAERRIQEKAAREAKVKEDQAKYIAEAAENRDPLELAVRELQVKEYNNTVSTVTSTLTNDYGKALKDFDVLNTNDPVVQAEIDQAIDQFQALNVTIDQYGNATEVRGSLYEHLQNKADSIRKLTSLGAVKQVKDKGKEKSKTLLTPTRAPKQAKSDPDVEAFDEEAKKY